MIKTSYMINFSRSDCIEVVQNDGRPFYNRLKSIGVLFDTKDEAAVWLRNKGVVVLAPPNQPHDTPNLR